jgi:Membrane bound beta barrel domain (DUF5777)
MMWSRVIVLVATLALMTGTVSAQNTTGSDDTEKKAAAPADAATEQEDDPDLDPNPAQPDFTIVNLPTTLRVARHKSAFRVTHRFGRPLGSGDFGSLLEDFFGLDSGAQIGLEYRFGLFRGTQVGIHRTSDRTIEFFGQYDLLGPTNGRKTGLAVLATIEGTNNFRDSYTPGIGAVMSYQLGQHGAVYVTPMYLNNTNLLPSELTDDNDTFVIGVGTRIRVLSTVYVLGEYVPRAWGYDPRVSQISFGIEKRVGGHSFQLNFNNGFGSTWGQMSRGGTSNDDWYLGFNISRKFF